VEQTGRLSGQQGWQPFCCPVTATGPNGPDRTLTWRYSRSMFFEWLFDADGDHEGWVEMDNGATLTASVTGVTDLFNSLAAGTDPHMVYTLPQAIGSTRFTALEVRLRTSNNYQNDDVNFIGIRISVVLMPGVASPRVRPFSSISKTSPSTSPPVSWHRTSSGRGPSTPSASTRSISLWTNSSHRAMVGLRLIGTPFTACRRA
jgi:hypothetical protein